MFTFVTTLIVYSMKKVHENYWCSSSIACQGKRTDCILKIFLFNDLKSMISSHNFDNSFFLRVKVIKE